MTARNVSGQTSLRRCFNDLTRIYIDYAIKQLHECLCNILNWVVWVRAWSGLLLRPQRVLQSNHPISSWTSCEVLQRLRWFLQDITLLAHWMDPNLHTWCKKKMRFRDKRLSARIFPIQCFWTFGHFTKLVCDPGANQRVHVFSCSLFQLTLPLGSNIHVHVCFCCHVCTAFASFPSQWSTDHMPQFPYVQLLLDDVPYT